MNWYILLICAPILSTKGRWSDAMPEVPTIVKISLYSFPSETPVSTGIVQQQSIFRLPFISGWPICESSVGLFPPLWANHQGPFKWPQVCAEREVPVQLNCALHPAYAWFWIYHFHLMMNCCWVHMTCGLTIPREGLSWEPSDAKIPVAREMTASVHFWKGNFNSLMRISGVSWGF